MQTNWEVYHRGAVRLAKQCFNGLEQIFQRVPESFKTKYDDAINQFLVAIRDWLYTFLGQIVNNVSSLIFGAMLTTL